LQEELFVNSRINLLFVVIMQNKKVILFSELNCLTIIVCVICKAFNYSIFYLDSSKYFRNESIFRILEFVNISKLNYEYFDDDVDYRVVKKISDFSKIIYNIHYKNNILINMIEECFEFDEDQKKIFELSIDDYLVAKLNGFNGIIGLLEFAERFSEKKYKTYIFVNRNVYTKDILDEYKKYKNIYPAWLSVVVNYATYSFETILFITSKAISQLSIKNKEKLNTNEQSCENNNESTKFDIIYFPHKGIYRGDLYFEDKFYIDNENSPFYKSKILHLSLGETEEVLKRTHEYYKEESIPYMDLYQQPGESILISAVNILRLMILNKHKLIKNIFYMDKQTFKDGLHFFRIISYNKSLIKALGETKIALIGYDFLFTPFMSLALSMCNIKTIAVQDRLLSPLWKWHKIILDYYFIFGESIEEKIHNGLDCCHIKNTRKLGVLKTDVIMGEEVKNIKNKYSEIKNNYYIILALDYIPAPNQIDNCEYVASSWKIIKKYYIDMIKLASNNPSIYIIIKGRNTSITSHPEFYGLLDVINNMPNIRVETNISEYTPSKMIAIADAAIALYTSMGDEMLAVGKPVLFYDYFGMPSSYFDYENYPVIVNSYDELEYRVNKIVNEGYFMDSDLFDTMRNRLYGGISNKNIKSILNQHLESIYKKIAA